MLVSNNSSQLYLFSCQQALEESYSEIMDLFPSTEHHEPFPYNPLHELTEYAGRKQWAQAHWPCFCMTIASSAQCKSAEEMAMCTLPPYDVG